MLHHPALLALLLATAGAGSKAKPHAKRPNHPVRRSAGSLGYVQVLGWTPDSRYFVYEGNTRLQEMGDQYTVVLDTHTGAEVDYIDPADDGQPDPHPPPGSEEFKVWCTQHPLAKATASRASADGKGRIDASFNVQSNAGWKDGTWVSPSSSELTLAVTRGAERVTSLRYRGAFLGFQPYWAPDGRRVVFLITEENRHFMGGGSDFDSVYAGPAVGPTIQLLGDPGRPAATPDAAIQSLENAGFAPTLVGQAHDARAKTTVFAPAALKSVAAKVAAAVPGGAEVAELTWKAPADLVVALGASSP